MGLMTFDQLPESVRERVLEKWTVKHHAVVNLVPRKTGEVKLLCAGSSTRTVVLSECIVWDGVRKCGYDQALSELYVWEGKNGRSGLADKNGADESGVEH